ncbi:beta-glucosidase [Leifsonia sp. 98AMF]|uniref:glycoside hydrolase family 3 C-terminal domain-containing protein n=1 Tax=unclassified Leifsonia TaxID=2663824 RepID=UPI00087A0B0E|nr:MULTISPECIES: glycoside hydrolase family 3 C-terminal domain-containing protein [unclassified Leifsonia]SDH33540.1 beta-glucosidase [Leifsonia sp. 197AMF]SDJ01552.1 beta-glucosidase [Leifsonia sp. 466MF]SDJ72035.1 beta-glucosidase [Leifsonia sp. 157MF]SDO05250.1 beta-glucosidase [Leifsonia sp. 509MF]SEM98866.1 beta-glucosidase [Leifsonia sp. 467MF]
MTDTTTAATAADISGLSVEEKASLTSGESFWRTKAVGDIPSVMLTDGPHGLRKQREGGDHLGIGDSVPATCFPPAVALGSSWDVELVERVGTALGVESSIEDVAVLLGPGINIKRSPLCGRNFEYLSEDPIVSGVLGAALVRGIQSQGVGASLKHFAANNQEDDRMRSSSDVDPRPLREIYLRGFQRVVEDAQPHTVMCSYNRINGVFASENRWLLTDVLRDEWGFQGLVVSDWGAVSDRVAALRAGLDLEMPGNAGLSDAAVVAAVGDGSLDESVLDASAARVAELATRWADTERVEGPLDVDAHHALAREAAGRSIVLLKNDVPASDDRPLLPLAADRSIAVIGAFAEKPRYQGAGSSMIRPTRLDDALTGIRAVAGDVAYAPGFSLAAEVDADESSRLRDEAVAAASTADVAVVFAGLPARLESEGYDRDDIDLPADQLAVIDAVVAANPRTVVVLSNGGVVTLPFSRTVPALVEGWLLGQAGGSATADVLFGAVNPSGKLTETVPLRLEDTPAFLNFPGEEGHVRYGEGLFVGYRWYDARRMEVEYPFGHGLSYTTFSYGDVSASVTASGDIEVRLTVTNTGERSGREVVQVYTSLAGSHVQRPPREIKGFKVIELEPGASGEVAVTVRREDLAYWDVRADRWVVEGGEYTIEVGASSRDLRARVLAAVDGDEVRLPLTRESSLGEVLAHPVAGPMVQGALAGMSELLDGASSIMPEGVSMERMMASFPIGRVGMMSGGQVTPDMIDGLLAAANAQQQ